MQPEKCIALYPKYRHDDDPEFGGPTEMVVGRLRVEGFRSHEDPTPAAVYGGAAPPSHESRKKDGGPAPARKDGSRFVELSGSWPNLGYLVTDTVTGRSVAHTGDVHMAYPQMECMRGRTDVLVYPLGKLDLDEKIKMMDYIRPRVAIPTHYRLFEPDFPIPAHFDPNVNEKACRYFQATRPDSDVTPELLRQAILGHWYPSPEDPRKEITEQREALRPYTRVVEVKAGVRYVLPENVDEFGGSES